MAAWKRCKENDREFPAGDFPASGILPEIRSASFVCSGGDTDKRNFIPWGYGSDEAQDTGILYASGSAKGGKTSEEDYGSLFKSPVSDYNFRSCCLLCGILDDGKPLLSGAGVCDRTSGRAAGNRYRNLSLSGSPSFLVRGEYGIAIGCVALDVVTSLLREFMEPRLLGKRLGIFPVVILASVYVGFWIYGPLGFVLGPLSLSVVYEIGKEWDVWD